jgi:hypothetical protein
MSRSEPTWGPWKVQRQKGTRLSSERWTVWRESGAQVEWLLNDAGRTKRFRSREAADKACDAANRLPPGAHPG